MKPYGFDINAPALFCRGKQRRGFDILDPAQIYAAGAAEPDGNNVFGKGKPRIYG